MGRDKYLLKNIDVISDKYGNEPLFCYMYLKENKLINIMNQEEVSLMGNNVLEIIADNNANLDRDSLSPVNLPALLSEVFQNTREFIKGYAFLDLNVKLVTKVKNNKEAIDNFVAEWCGSYKMSAKQLKPFADQLTAYLQSRNNQQQNNQEEPEM